MVIDTQGTTVSGHSGNETFQQLETFVGKKRGVVSNEKSGGHWRKWPDRGARHLADKNVGPVFFWFLICPPLSFNMIWNPNKIW